MSLSRNGRLLWIRTAELYCFNLIGTAALLAVGVAEGRTPIGILLDRLEEEEPSECEAPAEVVAEAVRWLRNRQESS